MQKESTNKTMFGWEMDKNVDDFKEVAKNLLAENQRSRGEAVLYLIERVHRAEKQIEQMVEESEQFCIEKDLLS